MAEMTYASNGKGNLGVTLGAIGTGLGVLGNGILNGGLFNLGARNNGCNGYPHNETDTILVAQMMNLSQDMMLARTQKLQALKWKRHSSKQTHSQTRRVLKCIPISILGEGNTRLNRMLCSHNRRSIMLPILQTLDVCRSR